MTTTEIAKPVWMTALAVDDDEYGYPKSIMLYGKPGTRKTSLAASLVKRPDRPTVVLLDVDEGAEALINDDEILAAKKEGRLTVIDVWWEKDENGNPVRRKSNEQVFTEVDYILQDLANNNYGIDFVIIDTLNLLQEVAVEHFLETTGNSSGKKDVQAAWGEISKWTNKRARALHGAPFITAIFNMHEKVATEETGYVSIVPKLQGGAKDSIAGIPSLVANLSFQKNLDGSETDLVAILGDSDIHVSKNRYSRFLDNRMTDFSLLRLYEQLDEHLATAPKPAAVAA